MAPMKRLFALALMGLAASPLAAGVAEVTLHLPVRARIDMQSRKTVGIAPFIVVSKEGEGRLSGHDVDIQKEFERYLDKLIRRETDLKRVGSRGRSTSPIFDLALLSKNEDFWRALGRAHAGRPDRSPAASTSTSRTAAATAPRSTSRLSTAAPTTARCWSSRPASSTTS